jgi:hypothetical protein
MKKKRNSVRRGAAAAAAAALAVFLASGLGAADTRLPEPDKSLAGAGASRHPEKCESCQAGDIWKSFQDHLRASGREDLIPAEPPGDPTILPQEEETSPQGAEPPAPKPKVDLQATDPIRGILFRMSNDLVNLDALFQEAEGKPLEGKRLEKARKLVAAIRASEDPFLRAYGDLHGARLDLAAGDHAGAVKTLDGLLKSCWFLPKREARRHLAAAYRGAGDDTLAILEIQFFLADLPPENEVDRTWAREELRQIREKDHKGPLHDSEASMRSISTLLAGLDVGEGTQAKSRRVEDVVDKVAKLLELLGGG